MSDAAPQNSQETAQPKMRIMSQYIRDMSFENIAAQKGTGGSTQPQIGVQVNLDANKKSETQYEVMIKLNINAEADGNSVFLMECEYAGLFEIENVPQEQLHPYLMIECPRMIFPFVRRIVSDVTRDGGYPPLNLETIDFLSLYRQELLRRQQEAKTEAPQA